ncbi:hypothetical protein VTP01DRAFT_10201 [Rhizomucor pusillus]|uniref:uncharacterized protein n=1 Tax=Rhizomucor pusillus TaxID=4840 RepID=UPI003742CA75
MKRSGSEEKIKVVCRVRPFLQCETPDNSVTVNNNRIDLENQRNPDMHLSYSFNSCYPMNSTQVEIFENDVRPLVDRVFEGYDATIFAYGVTGSGKTYTMEGTAQEPGIIPRVAEYLFETKQASQISQVEIEMSYMEILKESVYDLLVPRDKQSNAGLDVREDIYREVFVANLTQKPVETLGEFYKTFHLARRNRSTASTNLNLHSSRSHAILSLNVKTTCPIEPCNPKSDFRTMEGKIILIDLAGSEDNRKTGNKRDRMAESAAINKSLFVLGQVVEAINNGSRRIPFRDSKMTRILQSTLHGNSLGMMIVNVAPGRSHFPDTCNTLNFAKRSRQIKSQAKPNVRQIRVNLSPDIPIPDMPAMHHPYATRQAKRKALEMIEENLPPAKRTRGQICNRQSKMPLKEAHDATPSNTPDIARPQKKRRKLRSRTAAAAAPPHPDDVIIMTRKEFEQKCEEIVQQRLKQILKDYTPRRQPARARRR